MAKGGHARSGPPPDPNALRRDRDQGEWTKLPSAGRDGDVPPWPLPETLAGELDLWAAQWKRPQAVMWERNGQQLEVALFVRSIVVSEGAKATAADRNVVQRKMNDLGLTVPGLRANRWLIVDDIDATQTAPRSSGRRPSTRDRLKLVEGGST